MTENVDYQWWQIEAIFAQALDLPEDQRDEFLDEACEGDLYLKQQVKILLDTQKKAETFLNDPGEWFSEVPLMPGLPAAENQPTLDGTQIGPYRLLHAIGRGGMGQVYLAKREDEAFKQYVALKLIRRGMDTEDILRRFRTERQILASLTHENIARLLDGGSTAEGLSYFVMEYVDGVPITDYCDRHRLSIDERLKLFRQVCAAVQYAHQNLIVHRDLKPSNILVTPEGVPKLLDFGIAKLLNPNLSGYSVAMTRAEQRVMTPEYASPEQVRGETITTASDVYSLGVLLYELLAGHRPYRLESRLEAEVIRVICQQEPQRPSTAVSSVAAEAEGASEPLTAETISAARGVPVERLRRRLQGDLDTIVLMALKKEPARRYASVEQFSEDLRRYAVDLPVVARRDTLGYRARKFAGRHRVGVAMAAVLVLLLAGFAVAMAWQQAQTARALVQAEQEAAKSAQVTEFLVGLFGASSPWDPEGGDPTLTAQELLERGESRLEELASQPLVQAEMLTVIGRVHFELRDPDQASMLVERGLALRRQALGEEHEQVAQSLYRLADIKRVQGNYAEADSLLRAVLAMRRKLLGDEHEEVARSLSGLGASLGDQGQYAEADSLLHEVLAMQRKLHGDEHLSVAAALRNLGSVQFGMGDLEAMESVHREALAIYRKLLGEEHPRVALSMKSVGRALWLQGKFDEAEPLLREALARMRKLLGNEDPVTVSTQHNIAMLMWQRGQYDEAESIMRETLAIYRKILGEEHAKIPYQLITLAGVLTDQGTFVEAELLWRESLIMYKKFYDEDYAEMPFAMSGLGMALMDLDRDDEAEPLLREGREGLIKTLGEDHRFTKAAHSKLGAWLAKQGRYAEAEALLVPAYEWLEEDGGRVFTRRALTRLIALYEAWGQPDKAAQYCARQTQE